MPPKSAPTKKTVDKAKQKIIEDKTFGLKNKKGAKQQKFIQTVQKQVSQKGQQPTRRDQLTANEERQKKKEEELKKKEELSMLFKPVLSAQVVAKGVDPKSVLCAFFKQGLCQKGDKCKFSHDLSQERKAEKRSIYEDTRDKENDSMANWDDAKLEDVVNSKHGEDNNLKNTTQIVCKYFIEAVENSTYGWFWVCPNEKESNKCMYRHALPPGFTLKKDKKADDSEEIALETLIEKERAGLGTNVTRITLESFLAWKARKLKEKKDQASETAEKKKRDFKLGFYNGLTGRDLFTFNPDLIQNDDDDVGNDIDYKRRADDEEDEEVKEIHEINLENFQLREVDNTGTVASSDRFDYMKSLLQKEKEREEAGKLDMACGGIEDIEEENNEDEGEENEGEDEQEDEDDGTQDNIATTVATDNKNKLEIDESLFTLEDLSEMRDELENLDI